MLIWELNDLIATSYNSVEDQLWIAFSLIATVFFFYQNILALLLAWASERAHSCCRVANEHILAELTRSKHRALSSFEIGLGPGLPYWGNAVVPLKLSEPTAAGQMYSSECCSQRKQSSKYHKPRVVKRTQLALKTCFLLRTIWPADRSLL